MGITLLIIAIIVACVVISVKKSVVNSKEVKPKHECTSITPLHTNNQKEAHPPSLSIQIDTQVEQTDYTPKIPKYQGDYAKAVFLSVHQKPSPIKEPFEYQSYLLYKCGIKDAPEYHRTLISEGYLQESTDIEKLNALKVVDLKEILREANQPVSGKKDALIQRILSNCNVDSIIKSHCPNVLYSISEKGRDFLNNHDDYVQLHRNPDWGISWKEYDSKKRANLSFNDNIWAILNKKSLKSKSCGRNEYHSMYRLLVSEGNRPKALKMLLRLLYMDVSGIDGIEFIKTYQGGIWDKDELLDSFDVTIMVEPEFVNTLSEYTDLYTDALVDDIYEWKLPIQICDKQLFLDIVHAGLLGKYNKEFYEHKLEIAFKKAVEKL